MAGGDSQPALTSSRDQLDRLLAGLDELSGTLPDLSGGQGGDWPGVRECGAVRVPIVRGYEEDMDYALEREEGRGRGAKEADQAAPYHTRCDSKPFSYIRQCPSGPPSRAPSRERTGGLESPGLLRRVQSPPSPDRARHGSGSSIPGPGATNGGTKSSVLLTALNSTSSVLENSFSTSFSDSGGSGGGGGGGERGEEERRCWLQRQQQKLQERRVGQQRTHQESAFLIKELKSSLQRARSGGTETTDGYASDVNSLACSEPSREPSPAVQPAVHRVPVQAEPEPSQQPDSHIYSMVQKRSITPSLSTKKAAEMKALLSRQRSDTSYDRSWPGVQRRRQDSEGEAELVGLRTNGQHNGSCGSIDSAGVLSGHLGSLAGSRPVTPAFPQVPGTPLFNQAAGSSSLPPKSPASGLLHSRGSSRADLTFRAPSPAGSVYQTDQLLSSRRGSLSSEPTDVAASHVRLVKENHKWWYKQHISREEAIGLLRAQSPGTFIVRDSNSFPGAFGLALKVATPPQNGRTNGHLAQDELVRHFLIEPTSKGVKLKGYSNEPVFGSLSALIYQHTLTPLALPTRLVLPHQDLGAAPCQEPTASAQIQQLLQLGAACNVHYLFSMDTDQLTGPQAVRKTVSQLFLTRPLPLPTTVHFKVSGQGVTLTDQARKLFFRKHYNVSQISHCGVDPEDRRWSFKTADGATSAAFKIFAFVARKAASRACNQCHVFAELDSDQPARAIVNFVNKLMTSGGGTEGRPSDRV